MYILKTPQIRRSRQRIIAYNLFKSIVFSYIWHFDWGQLEWNRFLSDTLRTKIIFVITLDELRRGEPLTENEIIYCPASQNVALTSIIIPQEACRGFIRHFDECRLMTGENLLLLGSLSVEYFLPEYSVVVTFSLSDNYAHISFKRCQSMELTRAKFISKRPTTVDFLSIDEPSRLRANSENMTPV